MIQDPRDPNRSSRGKATSLAATVVAAIAGIATAVGFEIPAEWHQPLAAGISAVIFLIQYFTRDAIGRP